MPTRDRDRAREAAEQILSRPEFQEPPKPLPERIADAIAERISDVLESIVGEGAGSILTWVVAVAVFAAAAFAIWRLVVSLRGNPVVAGADTQYDDRKPARAWLAEAEQFEARHDWRQALRCRYRALVADLAARGVVEEVPGRTSGEYRAEVSSSLPVASGQFTGATALFENAWYGDRPTGPSEAEQFRDLADQVLIGAGR